MDWVNRTASLLLCLSILLATIHNGLGDVERKIVCYYTNWSIYRPGTAKFSPQNINPYLCTHLIYAFGGFTKDNALKPFDKYFDIEKGGYAKFTGLKTYNKNLKTLLAIGGWNEGSSRFSPMVADAARRREFVKNSIKFLRKNHFDGLDLDWEYPAFRDGGKPRDKDNYASLVQELREEFEREASKTGRPRLLLTLAMPAGIEYIDKGYDVPRLNEYLDFINLLSYDYHSSYEPAVNHHSPLYPLEEDNEYNYDSELTIDYTINYLLKKGASPEKIVLGIPTYGRSYTLFNPDATDLGSPADGPGVEGDATREKGYLAYYEICESLTQSNDWEVVQPNSKAMGPYAFKGDQWVGYDDEDIVKLKAKYANEKNLGGIMFWTIDNDDFRGKCHDRPYPLIEAAKEALLADSANAKTSSEESRKKPRIKSNAIGRKVIGGRSTTVAPAPKRITTAKPKFRNSFSRPRSSVEDEEEEEQRVDRRSYDQEEADTQGGNAVRVTDKSERSGTKPKTRIGSNRNRRKQIRRKEEDKNESNEESLSNKLTTPEPPTTPDPGTDFKCEDEGFFPHPRDCKKYFWCLDSGPGGLGVVAHQFTCPSGLVFNKGADSCDYPRNVICPKSKPSSSSSTTRAPITAATSRTTFLYSTTRQPTTEKPEEEEEYEYEDDDEELEEEEKEEPKPTTTPKPLLYKTITRNKPTTTTTTTTTTEVPSTSRRSDPERVVHIEDEEDPEVIKELIQLIKKAGGIEQLEKQLLFQSKSSVDATNSNNENATPATISRTLYERVLSRQAGKVTDNKQASTNRNGPGGAQFEGLDDVPEVKSLRRSQKPQYVTIERPKPSTEEPSIRDEEEEEDEIEEDNADVASSEERTVSNPFLTSSTQRATPNYINIRRARPTTSKDDNNLEEKNKNAEEETAVPRRAPFKTTETNSEDTKNQESRPPANEDNSQTTKSRYVNIQRFRSTTPQAVDTVSETSSSEPITESTSEPPKVDQTTSTTQSSVSSSVSTPNDIPVDSETERPVSSTVKLVEDTATEILLTTLSTPGTAAVAQPRPFSFNRRRPTQTETTTEASSNEQTRSKVASLPEVNKLPTLKDLIGYRNHDYDENQTPVFFNLLPLQDENHHDGERSSREKVANAYEDASEKNKRLDLSVDDINSYYVEDNVADDEESINKKRIDREDPLTTTLIIKPTTMRGIPLADLLHSTAKVPRGFYVTRDENETFEARITDTTPMVTDEPTTEIELKFNTKPSDSTVPTTEFTTKEILTDDDTTLSIARTDSIASSTAEQSLLVNPKPENVTENATSSETVPNAVNSTKNTELKTIATIVPSDDRITERTVNKYNNRRGQNIGFGYEFGRKSQGRQYTRPVSEESYIRTTEKTQYARRRFSTRRGQQRRRPPVTTTLVYETTVGSFYHDGDNETEVTGKVDQDLEQTTVLANETNNFIGTTDDRESSNDEGRGREIKFTDHNETKNSVGRSPDRENLNGNEKDFVPKANRTENIAGSEEHLQTEENVRPEVNSSKNTVTSRTPGSSPTTRLRKPTIVGGLTPYSKRSNTLANQRKIRPTDGNLTLVNKTLDAAGNKTEAQKPVKDIDQSSRAQEIAVTLADPPSLQSSATGRPPFRNALRRKISTTVAPRVAATTNRSTIRFTPASGDRHKPKTRDRSIENATTRPRRPPVLDYDYYEDEEEPVVGKSTYNGKLFLTSTGTIKCLDQGNFPHPYSCKKFITCARMVNGLVIGAEYTCPDTLSFDPVGGICNWSAGLGCKE
ncbi:mucin-5AC [Ceratina calcarata]|uniref:chitinase n=1 Tax=Ceratina calcarata TaxID=156304 RepID=A0AAJ7RYT5_9HYME|nr:mucin-5AC [Ceratina calcarata]